jgi:hypothetical protein
MHLSTRKLAFLGLLTSVTVLLIIFSGVFDFNTIFLLAAASFCVGIAFRESGYRMAFGFYIASTLLGFLLAPNKIYCITFAAMGIYILASEYAYDRLKVDKDNKSSKGKLWVVKYILFNLMYIPALIFLPKLFYAGKINSIMFVGILLFGQIALFVYDIAYRYFQGSIWGKVRDRLKL